LASVNDKTIYNSYLSGTYIAARESYGDSNTATRRNLSGRMYGSVKYK
jgi:hypothetical protein